MLFRELLEKQLEEKRDEFTGFSKQQDESREIYVKKIRRLEQMPYEEVVERLSHIDETGAFPANELDKGKSFGVDFDQTWSNHEESRVWAAEVLTNRTTFAVDGSQIPPTRDVSMTVAAVQIGWFENPHNDIEAYEKNVEFFVLSPNELMPSPEESRVNERRISEEVRRTSEFLIRKEGWKARGERMPLAFYDNTLLVPFPLSTDSKNKYIDEMQRLVELSEKTEVPLVGFVARSLSGDILTMLDIFDLELTEGHFVHDEDILFPAVLKKWGDRTSFCFAKRKGLTEAFGESVGFVYLQTTGDGTPARLDLPSWIFEQGLLDEVVDVVRAECVIGLGYPYVVESADQMAVITTQDREVFYRALQEFAEREKLKFTVSRKAVSKGRRR